MIFLRTCQIFVRISGEIGAEKLFRLRKGDVQFTHPAAIDPDVP